MQQFLASCLQLKNPLESFTQERNPPVNALIIEWLGTVKLLAARTDLGQGGYLSFLEGPSRHPLDGSPTRSSCPLVASLSSSGGVAAKADLPHTSLLLHARNMGK